MITRRTLLGSAASLSAVAGLGLLPRAGAAQDRMPLSYGWDENIAGPTQATVYVSPDGSDRARGTLERPVRTIQRGVKLLSRSRGGNLAIRGGTYRESIDLSDLHGTAQAPYHIHRYGRERVVITAANPLTGWQPCSAAEAEALGADPAGLYVARLSSGDLEHDDIMALNLHQGGVWRSVAIDRADRRDPETGGDQTTYHTGQFTLDAKGFILAITDPRLAGLDPEVVRHTKVKVYHAPNLVSTLEIADFNAATGHITLTERGPRVQGGLKKPVMLYALEGAPWALDVNTWVARYTRRREISVYFRPSNRQALQDNIEISLRPHCIELGAARHVTLTGLEVVRAAGADRLAGLGISRWRINRDTRAGAGIKLHHCRVGETLSTGKRGHGAVSLRKMRDLEIHNLSIGPARGGFGLSVLEGTNVDVRYLHVQRTSNSPVRFYTLRQSVFAFSLLEDSAWDAHANKFNFYEGSDRVLVYGVRCINVGGYATFQEASRIYFAFCDLPCDPKSSNRALVSQNRLPGAGQGGPDDSGDPVVGQTFYYWNNTLTATQGQTTKSKANAIALGPQGSSQSHGVFNSILFGGGFSKVYTGDAPARAEQRSHNRYTGLSFWQAARYGWQLGPGEAMMPLGAKPANVGRDMRDLIAQLAPVFPTFTDWDRDVDGRLVDWRRPPIGARV